MSEEEQKDLESRVEEYNKENVPLLLKYEVGLGASAFVKQDGTIGARPVLFSTRKTISEA